MELDSLYGRQCALLSIKKCRVFLGCSYRTFGFSYLGEGIKVVYFVVMNINNYYYLLVNNNDFLLHRSNIFMLRKTLKLAHLVKGLYLLFTKRGYVVAMPITICILKVDKVWVGDFSFNPLL